MPGAVQWKFRFTGPFVLHYVKEEKKSISQSLVACSLRYFKNTHQVSGTKVNFQIIKIYDIKQKKKNFFFCFAPQGIWMFSIGAMAASFHHSHSKAISELRLWPIPQFMAMPDP